MRVFNAEASAAVTSDPVIARPAIRETYRMWQVNFSAVGNVTIKGRNAADLNYIELATFASTDGADQAASVVAMLDMVAIIDSNTGTVTVDADLL